jgi:23S rRNA (uracil1939-C5)-methyltransferase
LKLIVEIQSLGHRGLGIGRHHGKVVMVPFSAPGDRLEVELVESHRSYDQARILRVLEPSPQRRDPPCPYFGACGGCQLQHLSISSQRSHKERILQEALRLQGKPGEQRLLPIKAGPVEFGYRCRLDLHVLWGASPRLGFASWGSPRLIPVRSCPLAMDPLNSALPQVQELLAKARLRNVRRVEVACDASGNGKTLLLSASGPCPEHQPEWIARMAGQIQGLRSVCLGRRRGGAVETLWRAPGSHGGILLPISISGGEDLSLVVWPGVFTQVNPQVNLMLIEVLTSWAGQIAPRSILDLYAGMGNLSLAMAAMTDHVTAVEVDPRAVANGIANSRRLGVENVTWVHGPAAGELSRMVARGERFDLVILDPPRSGVRELMGPLLALKARAILYVSCEPSTLARDLGHLVSEGEYRLERLQPLDMFPQTFHLESVSLLVAQGRVV